MSVVCNEGAKKMMYVCMYVCTSRVRPFASRLAAIPLYIRETERRAGAGSDGSSFMMSESVSGPTSTRRIASDRNVSPVTLQRGEGNYQKEHTRTVRRILAHLEGTSKQQL